MSSLLNLVHSGIRPIHLVRHRLLSGYADEVESPDLINLQYLGQIAITSFRLYALEVPDETYNTYQDLAAVNTTTVGTGAVDQQLILEAFNNVTQIINEPFTLALTGTLWLYPTAVGSILSIIRPLLMNRESF
jgi:hypothetical protein